MLLINGQTADRLAVVIDAEGGVVIAGVFPGNYTLRIESSGFKRLERQNLNVTAGERLRTGRLILGRNRFS